MKSGCIARGQWILLLYGVSGCAGLIYETVWIRAFALSFGNTLLSFSTVISVFLAGLALGATLGGRIAAKRPLLLYGAAEVWIAGYALLIPQLMEFSTRLLVPLYGPAGEGATEVAITRGVVCALILLPATVPMGAGLPWLLAALQSEGPRTRNLVWVYAANTVGGAIGAVTTGLILLPGIGYGHTLLTGSCLDAAVGFFAILLGRAVVPVARAEKPRKARAEPSTEEQPSRYGDDLRARSLAWVAFFSGCVVMLYEVAAARVAGLLFGPTAITVTLTLASVLLGLAAGSTLAAVVPRLSVEWLAGSQLGLAVLLIAASYVIAVCPPWLAERIRASSGDAAQTELLETTLIFLLLTPLMTAAGMALPLTMAHLQRSARNLQRGLGGLYGINTIGCIAGSLAAGWFLIPRIGTERTLYAGALVSAVLAIALFPGFRWRIVGLGTAVATVTLLVFPRWDMAAMTSGVYKYAAYYNSPDEELHRGEMEFLREGPAGTVTVRSVSNSQVLAIDGKVDATDGGGDLLTEKLLAHLPLSLIPKPGTVCVIGLASGVTAGAALTYPVDRLDVIEVSREVVQASRLFDRVNGQPLDSRRTHLILNDGRNHLALTATRYDAILSEPSNPWISGMNAMFTREFFQMARSRLAPGGVLAQWFHLYNMPPEDFRSLLRAFTEVFPAAVLWQLNEGDVLLTGSNGDTEPEPAFRYRPDTLPAAALADLRAAGVSDPNILPSLYLMRDSDLVRFAGAAQPNTDDLPVLEFHGQRDLDLQTSERNLDEIVAFPRRLSPPIEDARMVPTAQVWMARGHMFEKAESYHLAYESYRTALAEIDRNSEALAGMLRSARSPEEVAAAGTLATRTEEALADARNGDLVSADWELRAVTEAWPERPEGHLNYGLFCLDNSRYQDAIRSFHSAIDADARYLPAFEALAKTYLRMHDLPNAALWSRHILDIDPAHAAAKQVLAALNQ